VRVYAAQMATTVGPESGELLVRTSREGLAAKVGHDLTLRVDRWSAQVTDDNEVTASIDLATLTVVGGTGGKPLTDSDRAEIVANSRKILGPATATFTGRAAPDSSGGGTIDGTLTLNSISRPLQLVVRQENGTYTATATVVQSAYGVKPYSAFLGALKLRDEVTVEVIAHSRRT
jgi:YceI-like domain